MGVRFPTQPPPDFGQMERQAGAAERNEAQQQADTPLRVANERAQLAEEEETNVRRAEEARPTEQPTRVERAAQDAGTQTPGGIIDLLA